MGDKGKKPQTQGKAGSTQTTHVANINAGGQPEPTAEEKKAAIRKAVNDLIETSEKNGGISLALIWAVLWHDNPSHALRKIAGVAFGIIAATITSTLYAYDWYLEHFPSDTTIAPVSRNPIPDTLNPTAKLIAGDAPEWMYPFVTTLENVRKETVEVNENDNGAPNSDPTSSDEAADPSTDGSASSTADELLNQDGQPSENGKSPTPKKRTIEVRKSDIPIQVTVKFNSACEKGKLELQSEQRSLDGFAFLVRHGMYSDHACYRPLERMKTDDGRFVVNVPAPDEGDEIIFLTAITDQVSKGHLPRLFIVRRVQ